MKLSVTMIAPLVAMLGWGSGVLAEEPRPRWSIAIHGGAGTLDRKDMTVEKDAAYRASLQAALDAGRAVLAAGGSALDAVTAVVTMLEDDPAFNAGKGAVYTWDGTHELDAAIMDGRRRAAGSVAGVTTVRNPILLARKVMEDSPHVMLAGRGAEQFAAEKGLALVPNSYFDTPARLEALERLKADKLSALDVDTKFGTVGAVALDSQGNLAAATSTGGMTGKRWGRIGDAPIIGAGTYAQNDVCAVSATGWGEFFIRVGVAQQICSAVRQSRRVEHVTCPGPAEATSLQSCLARPLLRDDDVQAIADKVMAEVADLGGDGGVIVVAPDGNAVFSFNTSGMYRGRATSAGLNEVAIYEDER